MADRAVTQRSVLSMSPHELGAWVYERRTALGLSQTDVSAMAELDRSAVMYIEQGRHAARVATRTALWWCLRERRCPIEREASRLLKRHTPEAILRAAEQVAAGRAS